MKDLSSALLQGLADAHRDRVAACLDHDLSGLQVGKTVFATCSKCGGRFKVRVES